MAGSANLSKFVAHPIGDQFSSFRFSAKPQLAKKRRGPDKFRGHSMTRGAMKSMRYNPPCSNQKEKSYSRIVDIQEHRISQNQEISTVHQRLKKTIRAGKSRCSGQQVSSSSVRHWYLEIREHQIAEVSW